MYNFFNAVLFMYYLLEARVHNLQTCGSSNKFLPSTQTNQIDQSVKPAQPNKLDNSCSSGQIGSVGRFGRFFLFSVEA